MVHAHQPKDWFSQGTYPSCSCGFAPNDNLKLNEHWEDNSIRWVDDHGTLKSTEVI